MAAITHQPSHRTGGRSFATRIAGAAHHFASEIHKRNERNAAVKALAKLTNRELDDIGLTRGHFDRMG